jgi:microsomal dipeptidase-like Zn-dependent dipeptidase
VLRHILKAPALLLVLALAYAFILLPGRIESGMNEIHQKPPYNVSQRARDLIRQSPIVDLHVDSLHYDTEIGGSSAGMVQGGLTPLGKQWVREMESRKMIVDLAHASPAAIDDVLAMATRPVVVSHTGVKGTCDNPRNLSDAHLRGVAKTGGLIGITFFDFATCESDAAAIAKSIKYTAGIAGVDDVAFGSDFDGAVETPFDVTGVGLVVDSRREI